MDKEKQQCEREIASAESEAGTGSDAAKQAQGKTDQSTDKASDDKSQPQQQAGGQPPQPPQPPKSDDKPKDPPKPPDTAATANCSTTSTFSATQEACKPVLEEKCGDTQFAQEPACLAHFTQQTNDCKSGAADQNSPACQKVRQTLACANSTDPNCMQQAQTPQAVASSGGTPGASSSSSGGGISAAALSAARGLDVVKPAAAEALKEGMSLGTPEGGSGGDYGKGPSTPEFNPMAIQRALASAGGAAAAPSSAAAAAANGGKIVAPQQSSLSRFITDGIGKWCKRVHCGPK
jgi:hypothetical protein